WHHLNMARYAGINTHYGEVLSEHVEYDVAMDHYSTIIAATDNSAYNALVCATYAHEFGRDRVFQIGVGKQEEEDPRAYAHTIRGRTLLPGMTYDMIHENLRKGWKFKAVKL